MFTGMEDALLVDDGSNTNHAKNGVIPLNADHHPVNPVSPSSLAHREEGPNNDLYQNPSLKDLHIQVTRSQSGWLVPSPKTARRMFLASVLRHWQDQDRMLQQAYSDVPPSYQTTFGLGSLESILEDLWAVERLLQPDFDVAVLHTSEGSPVSTNKTAPDKGKDDTESNLPEPTDDTTNMTVDPDAVWGVVTSSARPSMEGFYIHSLALRSSLFTDTEACMKAADKLVETIIDASQDAGLRGWVICSSTDSTALFWRRLGFTRQAGPFFSRMGYFDRPPVRQPI